MDHPPGADRRAARRPTTYVVVNDFGAVGHAVAQVPTQRLRPPLRPRHAAAAPRAITTICGPGTGLGVAQVLRTRGRLSGPRRPRAAISISPRSTGSRTRCSQRLRKTFTRVSAERVVAGPGIVAIYETLAAIEGRAVPATRRQGDLDRWRSTARTASRSPRSTGSASRSARSRAISRWRRARRASSSPAGSGLRLKDHLLRSGFAERFVAKGRFQQHDGGDPGQAHHPSPARPVRRRGRLRAGTRPMTDYRQTSCGPRRSSRCW